MRTLIPQEVIHMLRLYRSPGKAIPLIPWRPYRQETLPKSQTKSSIYLSLFSVVAPQAALHFPFGLHSSASFAASLYPMWSPQPPPMNTQDLLAAINQRLQRSPCPHAHLLPNPFPTLVKPLSRGTSLLIHMSIKSIRCVN